MTQRTPRSFTKAVYSVFVGIVSIASTLGSPVLLWDANPDPNVAGYRVYSGTSSRTYSSVVDVGLSTSNVLSGLNAGLTYYFAVTAYTADGLESPFSDEVYFTPKVDGVTAAITETQLTMEGAQPALSFTAELGQQYRVVATSDFETWQEVYATVVSTNGTMRIVDAAAESAPMRFYRTIVTPVLPGLTNTNGVLGNVLSK